MTEGGEGQERARATKKKTTKCSGGLPQPVKERKNGGIQDSEEQREKRKEELKDAGGDQQVKK